MVLEIRVIVYGETAIQKRLSGLCEADCFGIAVKEQVKISRIKQKGHPPTGSVNGEHIAVLCGSK